MPQSIVHTPPHRKHHQINYTRERILIIGSNKTLNTSLIDALSEYDVDIFDSQDSFEWGLEHSVVCTQIPLYFDNYEDANMLPLLGKHLSTGKVIPCCSSTFPFTSSVQTMCAFDGIPLLTYVEDLLKTLFKRLRQPVE